MSCEVSTDDVSVSSFELGVFSEETLDKSMEIFGNLFFRGIVAVFGSSCGKSRANWRINVDHVSFGSPGVLIKAQILVFVHPIGTMLDENCDFRRASGASVQVEDKRSCFGVFVGLEVPVENVGTVFSNFYEAGILDLA